METVRLAIRNMAGEDVRVVGEQEFHVPSHLGDVYQVEKGNYDYFYGMSLGSTIWASLINEGTAIDVRKVSTELEHG